MSWEKHKDKVRSINHALSYLKVLLKLNELDRPAPTESVQWGIQEGIATVKKPLLDREPWPQDDAPNTGTPLNESEARHIVFTESVSDTCFSPEEWDSLTDKEREAYQRMTNEEYNEARRHG
jgi:hypothetical protein